MTPPEVIRELPLAEEILESHRQRARGGRCLPPVFAVAASIGVWWPVTVVLSAPHSLLSPRRATATD